MQTTLRIDDGIYREAKAEAARQGITLTKFIEEALRLRLERIAADSAHPEARSDSGTGALIKRLELLFEQADERDCLKEGSAGPFSRQELYAERRDRFR
jgi:antitoxin component of RelBE/YafQ-DinJ toxin-antitoxin module